MAIPPPGPICASSRAYPSSDIDKASTPDNDPIVDFLFTQCLNPVQGLSGVDYEMAATSLGVEEAAIKAVSEVETAGHAFDEYGRPKILFE